MVGAQLDAGERAGGEVLHRDVVEAQQVGVGRPRVGAGGGAGALDGAELSAAARPRRR